MPDNSGTGAVTQPGTAGVDRRTALRAMGAGLAGLAIGSSQVPAVVAQEAAELLWERDVGTPRSAATVVDDTVFVGAHDEYGQLHALDAADGAELWSDAYFDDGRSAPSVVDGTAVMQADHSIHGYDAASGEELWEHGGASTSPTIADGLVHVGASDVSGGAVKAVDLESGDLEWEFLTESNLRSHPVVVDGTVFVTDSTSKLYAIVDGEENWQFSIPEEYEFTAGLTVAGEYVIAGARYDWDEGGRLYAVDRASGEEQWTYDVDEPVRGVPTVADGAVVFRTHLATDHDVEDERFVYAVDLASQEERWSLPAEGHRSQSAPTVADGVVYLGGRGEIVGVDVATGDEVWHYDLPDNDSSTFTAPTVVDGTVFAGASDSIMALDAHGDGSSTDSRVLLGTLGHHDGWTGDSSDIVAQLEEATEADEEGDDDSLPGPGFVGTVGSLVGAGYVLKRWAGTDGQEAE